MVYVRPFNSMLLSSTTSVAPPLNLPAAWASVTVPTALDPAGMAFTPFTTTDEDSVASKRWPSWLVFEPIECTSLTCRTVPAGTTIGGGGGGGGGGAAAAGVAFVATFGAGLAAG